LDLAAPLVWEMDRPSFYWEKLSTTEVENAVRADTNRQLRALSATDPTIRQIHPMEVDDVGEDTRALASTLLSLQTFLMFDVPTYVEWMLLQDQNEVFRFWHAQLRLLSLGRPAGARFILKWSCPALMDTGFR